jgi:23S rRNA (guanosine2251-2'-O)-methyltransferase
VSEVVYGRRPVFEALRGRREVARVWCTARSREALDWLPERVSIEAPERLSARAESEEHQGVVAEVAPYPYAGVAEVMAGERPLVVALDEVTDPHNLGAVARVAEGAGAGGLVITRRRSAVVTAAVCRASAGAVEHLRIARVENLAQFLIDARRPGLWSYAAVAGAAAAYGAADYRDGAIFVLGAEGRGLRPRVRSSCDQEVAIPLGGRIESLNVSTAAAVLLFEARRQRGLG